MAVECTRLCLALLRQYFGPVVAKVADCLLGSVSRSLYDIKIKTKMPTKEICLGLAVLIKHQLADFKAAANNANICEYTLRTDNILSILRYARYIQNVHTKYDDEGVSIVEELMYCGSQTGTRILQKLLTKPRYKDRAEALRDVLCKLIHDHYLVRSPRLITSESGAPPIPEFEVVLADLFAPPNIDLRLLARIAAGIGRLEEAADEDIFWTMNLNRFNQDLRDGAVIDAIGRKLDKNASECFLYMLKQVHECTDPWEREETNPFTVVELKHLLEKSTAKNKVLLRYLDQYITLIAEDSLSFIRRVGDMGCGQYVVRLGSAFEQLALACIERVITERFGSKATRIFRAIRTKGYVEQEDLQKEAMMPSKEAKSICYLLFREQFIHIQTIRKAGSGGGGPTKAYYLFHIKTFKVAKMLLDTCYKAIYNCISRANYEKLEQKYLIDKSQKIDSIVAAMKERGGTEVYIQELMETLTPYERGMLAKVKGHMNTLSIAEMNLEETVFLLEMYLYHSANMPSDIRRK